jgi:hypothetical protein
VHKLDFADDQGLCTPIGIEYHHWCYRVTRSCRGWDPMGLLMHRPWLEDRMTFLAPTGSNPMVTKSEYRKQLRGWISWPRAFVSWSGPYRA